MTTVLRPAGTGRLVLLCDHAANFIPPELQGLGLPAAELDRHIAWDIGAASVTHNLSEIFDAPAILCGVSRLVIDCNRQLNASDLIPEISDGTVIPGNLGLSPKSKSDRIERWFHPYHTAVETILTERDARGVESIVVSIHSMTAQLRGGEARPWQIALSSHDDRTLTDRVLARLRAHSAGITVGDNQPYDLDPAVDYSIPFHAIRRGLPYLQVEFRQDEIEGPAGQSNWSNLFAGALPHEFRDSCDRQRR